jgi:triosephosphate isomerase
MMQAVDRVDNHVLPIIRKPCVVGNWKMYGSKERIVKLISQLRPGSQNLASIDFVVCPPAIYLEQVYSLIQSTTIQLGAQNVYCEVEGPYTGELSPRMLSEFYCRYVIIGHSERRQWLGERNDLIARKFLAAYHEGLIPILCVGETLTEHAERKTNEVIVEQLSLVLEQVPIEAFKTAMVAYEPVWAIGTGISATPEQAQTVHALIRSLFLQKDKEIANQLRILYGGSVKADSADALFAQPDIDGGLIGGASLIAQEFLLIGKAAMARTLWNKSF